MSFLNQGAEFSSWRKSSRDFSYRKVLKLKTLVTLGYSNLLLSPFPRVVIFGRGGEVRNTFVSKTCPIPVEQSKNVYFEKIFLTGNRFCLVARIEISSKNRKMFCILNIAQLKQTSFCYNLQVCMRYVRSLLTSRVPCFRVLLTAMKEKKNVWLCSKDLYYRGC